MTKEKIIEKAIEAGGKRWTKEDLDRVYINPHVIGYTFDYYNTGNICSAKDPDGDSISNTEGRRVKSYKAWIDCKDGTPHTRSNSNDFDGFFQQWFEELTKEDPEQEAEQNEMLEKIAATMKEAIDFAKDASGTFEAIQEQVSRYEDCIFILYTAGVISKEDFDRYHDRFYHEPASVHPTFEEMNEQLFRTAAE